MTLAQETSVILLDEPTTFLDLAHQIEVLHLLERLNRAEGRTIVVITHAGELAASLPGRIAMRDGAVEADS